ncbi:hypothetical protein CsSME_00042468 [Camellia sinensis var. sinensis]
MIIQVHINRFRNLIILRPGHFVWCPYMDQKQELVQFTLQGITVSTTAVAAISFLDTPGAGTLLPNPYPATYLIFSASNGTPTVAFLSHFLCFEWKPHSCLSCERERFQI